MKEIQCMSKKGKVLFCFASLQRPGHVCAIIFFFLPLYLKFYWLKYSIVLLRSVNMSFIYSFSLSYSFQRRSPTAGSTMSFRSSCTQITAVLSPRRQATCTSPKQKLRTQGTTPALFPVPSLERVFSLNTSPSFLCLLRMVSACAAES